MKIAWNNKLVGKLFKNKFLVSTVNKNVVRFYAYSNEERNKHLELEFASRKYGVIMQITLLPFVWRW